MIGEYCVIRDDWCFNIDLKSTEVNSVQMSEARGTEQMHKCLIMFLIN